MGENIWKPKPMSPAVQPKLAACHSADLERALEVAFRKMWDEEKQREEERREEIRRASRSPLTGLEPMIFSRRSKS